MDFTKRRLKMLALREKNVSIGDIGKMFHISRQRVQQIIGNTGHRAKKPAPKANLVMRYSGRYKAGELGQREIAEATGIPVSSVNNILHTRGVTKFYTDRRELLAMGKGRCYDCKRVKRLELMGKDASRVLGYGRCKLCNRKCQLEYYHRMK